MSMDNSKPQWRNVWIMYSFLIIFSLLYTLVISNVLLSDKEFDFSLVLFFACLHLVVEWGSAGYAGWKTKKAGAGLASCFKVGVICSLAITLGIMSGIYLSPIDSADESWDSFILNIAVWYRLLSFWLPGLSGLVGGAIHNK